MKRILSALFALCLATGLFAQPANTTSTQTVMANKDTGVLVAPSLFFSGNNVVQSTNTYANPSWLTSLAWAKLTGVPSPVLTLSGDASGSATFATLGSATLNMTLANTAIVAGYYGSATQVGTFTVDSKGRLTAASNVTVTPALGSITGLGAGVPTWLATPTSANLAGALTDKTGTGVLVFSNSPALVTPNLGTPSAVNLTNGTSLPIVAGTTGTLTETRGGTNQSTYALGDTLYSSAANTLAKLPGNTSATTAVLTQTGTGTVSAAPVWTTTTGTGSVVLAASPALSGTPTAPTAAVDTNTTQVATTAFAKKEADDAQAAAISAAATDATTKANAAQAAAIAASQPLDADLTSIAGNTTGGFLTRTAANTYTPRTITGTPGEIDVADGAGVNGAPTISLPSTITQATTFSANTNFGANIYATGKIAAGGASGQSTLEVKAQSDDRFGGLFLTSTDNNSASIYRLSSGALNFRNGGVDWFSLSSAGVASFTNTTASTSTTTGSATFGGGIGVAGAIYGGADASFAGRVIVGGGTSFSTNYPLRLNQGATDATVIADVVNTSAGTSASAGWAAQSDAGVGNLRIHSLAHSVWPGKLLIGAPSGGTGIAMNTGGAGDPIQFYTNNLQRGEWNDSGLTITSGGITGGAAGLTINSGGTNQSITLTPSGTGNVRQTAGLYRFETGAIAQIGTFDANHFELVTNSTQRIRVTSGGNVLIGTTTDIGDRQVIYTSGSVASATRYVTNVTGTTATDGLTVGVDASGNGLVRSFDGPLTLTGAGTGVTTGSVLSVTNSTASNSTTSGSATFAGGVGVAGALYAGGEVFSAGSVASTGDSGNPSSTVGKVQMYFRGNIPRVAFVRPASASGSRIFDIVTGDGSMTLRAVSDDYTTVQNLMSWLGSSTAAGTVNVFSTTASTSTTTGAFTVGGGIGVAGAGYFGGSLNTAGQLNFTAASAYGPIPASGTGKVFVHAVDGAVFYAQGSTNDFALLNKNGYHVIDVPTGTQNVKLPGTTASTSPTTGALTVAGGIGVSGAGYFGGAGYFNGATATPNYAAIPSAVRVGGTTAAASVSIARDSNDTGAPRLVFGKSRGTTVGSVTAAANGDTLFDIYAAAADGTNVSTLAANITATVDGTVSTGVVPGKLVLRTSSASGVLTDRLTIDAGGKFTFAPSSYSAASWTTTGALSQFNGVTVTNSSTLSGNTAPSAVFHSFAQPTLAATNTSVTTTDAATVYIAGAPTTGTNQTITNPWALWVAGALRVDGKTFSGPTYVTGSTTAPTSGSYVETGTSGSNGFIRAFNRGTSTAMGLLLNDGGGNVTLGTTASAVSIPGTIDATSTTTGALQVAGGGSFQKNLYVGGNVTTAQNQNGAALVTVTNSNAGAAASSRFVVDNGTTTGGIQMPGTGASGANSVRLYVNGANDLRFWTASADRGGFNGAGEFSLTSTTEATTGGAGSLTTAGGIYAAKAVVANRYENQHSTLTYSATTNLDFATTSLRTLTLTNNVTFTTSNLAAGRSMVIRILPGAASRTFTFPAGWVFLGSPAPSFVEAGKTAVLSLTAFGSADTDVVASYAAQP